MWPENALMIRSKSITATLWNQQLKQRISVAGFIPHQLKSLMHVNNMVITVLPKFIHASGRAGTGELVML